ncbi:MAG: flagellar basal-body rod protein FlgG [Helicobacteraceae bacterium]|jgi:flagellar basal-body rod protein FlgG|nr:flagellar basal-body rod protein FlgG [Helicobacteraceae bacterium]
MIRSLYAAATGMKAQQLSIDAVSNNIANVNTTGYKKQRAEFADLMYQVMEYAGTSSSATTISPTGIEVGLGVRPTAIQKIFSQGNYKETGNQLDVAISGDGFFQIQLPDGTTAYTRAGAFKLDENGTIVTADGYPLLPQVVVPADTTQLTIGADGTISVMQAGQTQSAQIGQFELANFINPAGLHSLGDNNYVNTTASGDAVVGQPGLNGFGQTRQLFLELSNVQLVDEMTDLITGQRAYEAGSKAITTSDEMLSAVNGLKR